MRTLSVLTALCLAPMAAAQCGTLTVTGSGAAGSSVTVTVTGAPRALAFLAIGETAGTTSIPVGTATLDLGVAMPFAPFPLGLTSATGSASATFQIPANIPAADAVLQGVTAAFTVPNFSLSFCTSNVVTFHIG